MGLEPGAKLFFGRLGANQPVTREHAADVHVGDRHGPAGRGRRAAGPPALRSEPPAQSLVEPQQAGLDAIRRRARNAAARS